MDPFVGFSGLYEISYNDIMRDRPPLDGMKLDTQQFWILSTLGYK